MDNKLNLMIVLLCVVAILQILTLLPQIRGGGMQSDASRSVLLKDPNNKLQMAICQPIGGGWYYCTTRPPYCRDDGNGGLTGCQAANPYGGAYLNERNDTAII